MSKPIQIISLGAGVQSSVMALMAAAGELTPMPDAAVFADTESEPRAVYEWLNQLEPMLPFPVYRVSVGSLRNESLTPRPAKSGGSYIRNVVPAYTINNKGEKGMLPRKCTVDFKIVPLKRKQRALMIAVGATKIVSWLGISLDEATRMKPSRVKYIEHHFPLIDRRMTRLACLDWMRAKGLPLPPKSACSFCPYHSDDQWRELKLYDKAAFDDAVQFEQDWNAAISLDHRPTQLRGRLFLHRSCQPLDQVDFRNAADHGQRDLFEEECEGMCGL